MVFKAVVEFIDKTVFKNRVKFQNKDMSGFAKVLVEQTTVDVKFARSYEFSPIINVTQKGDIKDFKYLVENIGNSGFTIEINPIQLEDVEFNWMALSVRDAQTQQSTTLPQLNFPTATPTGTTTPTVTPSPTATETLSPAPSQ